MKKSGPVKHRRFINNEWVETIIQNPPITNFKKAKNKKPPKKPRHKKKSNKKIKKVKDPFYSSHEWAKVRYQALKISNGKCQLCGRGIEDGVTLHVDHIKPKSKYPHLSLNINNLQVLCSACNWGKYNRDETDWRPGWMKNDSEWLHLKGNKE